MRRGEHRPANLVFLLPTLTMLGGTERIVVSLLEGLDRERYTLSIATLGRIGPEIALPEDVSVYPLRGRSFGLALPAVVSMLRRSEPELVLAHMTLANLWALLGRRLVRQRFPVVCVEHAIGSIEYAAGSRRRLLKPLMRALYPGADAIVAVSDVAAGDVAATTGLGRDEIDVIFNPVIGGDFDELRREAPADDWFDDPEVDVVLSVGRLVPAKDVPFLLRAFKLVVADAPRARLLVYGEGPERARLEHEISALRLTDVVRLPGATGNPYAPMSRASVFVLASAFEAAPMVIVEAMACGSRIVATGVGGIPELLGGGQDGLIVESRDEHDLAAAILRQLRGDGPVPRAAAIDPFRVETAVARYDKLCWELLGRQPEPSPA